MILGQPWALALIGLAIPIVVLHLLRGHPRQQATTAAFLWRGLDQQVTSHRKWRRPPRSLAMLLQLLAVAVVVLALARPAHGEFVSRQVVYILDASASMQATDVSPSRFEAARAAIRDEIGRLGPGDRATLIRLGSEPTVVAAGSDKAELLDALASVRPGAAPVSLRTGLAMAGQRVEKPANQGSEVVVFSDGTLQDAPGLGLLPVPVRFVNVGTAQENQGVSLLQVRRAPGEIVRFAGFARITNYSDSPTRVPVRLSADALTLETRLVDLPARGRAELPFDLPAGARSVSVVLGGRDQLALDDRAEVTVPENRRRSALLVSRSPEAWEQALTALPGIDLETQAPESYQDSGAEIVVFDGFLPSRLPAGQLLIVNPPPGNGLVDVVGDVRDTQVISLDSQQPLLRSIDLGALRLVRASRLVVPRWATSVAETPGGPLMLAGTREGRRVVVLGFDPLVSGLEKLIAFPILVSNAVDYLGGSGTDPWVAPGQSITLPVAPETREAVLERPDGGRETLTVRDGAVKVEQTDQIGRYTVVQRLVSSETVSRTFFVDLFGETETDIGPREVAPWPPAAPLEATVSRPGAPAWMPFIALALVILAVEWLHFVRRG